jgi:aspartate aminotransferase
MGLPFAPESIHMTNGAAGALHIAFYALLDAGDEVIMNLPPWFFYESFIQAAGGVPVKVPVRADDFDLDVAAIAAAITPKTRAVVVNSPNNPTGKIYPADTLQALARVLREASARYGRPIYLISDEAYNRIVFDGRSFESPVSFYENALLIYTYGKTLLTPGQWLGYIALHPQAHARAGLSDALHTAQWVNGFAWPSALMQYALPDFERMLIDVEALQHKRDWMVRELRSMGYIVSMPEGTFYLMVRSPLQDDVTFVRHLTGQSIFCLPGSVMEVPGWFRISLTANEDMIARSLAGFACLAPGSSE